jgi:hypothetical protein
VQIVPTHDPPPSSTLCSSIDLGRPAPRGAATPPPGLAAGAWAYLAPSDDGEDRGPSTLRSPEPTPQPSPAVCHAGPADPSSADAVPLEAMAPVFLTPARATLVAGGTLQVSAAAPTLNALTWSIFPRGMGSVAANEGERARATYTAPASVTEPTTVMVMAYGVDGAVGIGVARITVEPAVS